MRMVTCSKQVLSDRTHTCEWSMVTCSKKVLSDRTHTCEWSRATNSHCNILYKHMNTTLPFCPCHQCCITYRSALSLLLILAQCSIALSFNISLSISNKIMMGSPAAMSDAKVTNVKKSNKLV